MIISEGYTIMQEPNKNRIIIGLPQTVSSQTTTTIPMSGRRKVLTTEEETVLLSIVKALFKGQLVNTE